MVSVLMEVDLCALLVGLSVWSWLIGSFDCGRRTEGKLSTAFGIASSAATAANHCL